MLQLLAVLDGLLEPEVDGLQLAADLRNHALELFDFTTGLLPEGLAHFQRTLRLLVHVPSDLLVLLLGLELLDAELVPQAHVVHPVSQINDVVSILGVHAGVLEFWVRLELEKLLILGIRQVLEVNVDQSEDEVLASFVFEGLVSEYRPLERLGLLAVDCVVNGREQALQHALAILIYWQLHQFLWLDLSDGFFDSCIRPCVPVPTESMFLTLLLISSFLASRTPTLICPSLA